MMAEPTLGARILDAAEAYANAVQEAIQTWGAGEWTGHHDEATAEEMATLRALCDRATAAERGMVARIRWNDMSTTNSPAALWDALIEVQDSEAAWRALGEVDG